MTVQTQTISEASKLLVGDKFLIGGWIAEIKELYHFEMWVGIVFEVGGSHMHSGEFATPADCVFTIIDR